MYRKAAWRYYAPSIDGIVAWQFARGKLHGDPVFAALTQNDLLPPNARILDLGCGQGLLAAWLLETQTDFKSYRGIDMRKRDIQHAQTAFAGNAGITFECNDITTADLTVEGSRVDAIVMLDVLHYLDHEQQEKLLRRARAALISNHAPGGVLLLRVANKNAGLPFQITYWTDRVIAFCCYGRMTATYCRPLAEWQRALVNAGFTQVTAQPMSAGTPFANVLLIAH